MISGTTEEQKDTDKLQTKIQQTIFKNSSCISMVKCKVDKLVGPISSVLLCCRYIFLDLLLVKLDLHVATLSKHPQCKTNIECLKGKVISLNHGQKGTVKQIQVKIAHSLYLLCYYFSFLLSRELHVFYRTHELVVLESEYSEDTLADPRE